MDPLLQAKFRPMEAPKGHDYSDAKIGERPGANSADNNDKSKVNFRDLILNSNDEVSKTRQAQKNGDQLRMAKTDADFAKMLTDKANQGNLRKPQNELDKDAFLKLFITQMRNQDPLNPDKSDQMAAQLAQFHGLEQMMNVNKNLEKMQADASLGRAVGLIDFVGKDIKLSNGKLAMEKGKLSTPAVAKLEADATNATLEIRDSAGVLMASKALGPMTRGEHPLAWEGAGKDGKPLADGAYTFSLAATDVHGQAIGAPITSTVKVTGVDLHDQGGSFYTPLGKVAIAEVASVGATEATPPAKPAKIEGASQAAANPSTAPAAPEHEGGVGSLPQSPGTPGTPNSPGQPGSTQAATPVTTPAPLSTDGPKAADLDLTTRSPMPILPHFPERDS